ncbi:hypothetical protein LJR290_002648 [Variovorax sp. LjRoot290]|uniref:hypothetical protein n=1 Tax=unclassified Variovorax TaxID=663243 RepID=UPI003ECF0E35
MTIAVKNTVKKLAAHVGDFRFRDGAASKKGMAFNNLAFGKPPLTSHAESLTDLSKLLIHIGNIGALTPTQ